jgi:hypothetical protein
MEFSKVARDVQLSQTLAVDAKIRRLRRDGAMKALV